MPAVETRTHPGNEYHRIFNKVYNKRLKYVLNVNIILSVLMVTALDAPFRSISWNGFLIAILLKVPIFFIALGMIRQARKKFSTVEYSVHKTLGSQIYYSIISKQFIRITLFYAIAAISIYGVFIFHLPFTYDYYLISKEYRKSPLLNDAWVFYWYSPLMLAAYYSASQLIFQRNRLKFEIGHSRKSPEKTLFSHISQAIGNAFGLNLIFTLANPVFYWFIKPYLYKSLLLLSLFGIDTSTPASNTSISTYCKESFLAYIVLLSWELVNHVFDVYATIGCLDGKKPISTYSEDPLRCLLAGLRDVSRKHQISRLTAFQELAYIATSNDREGIKLRLALFSSKKKVNLWPDFYEECALVIREVSERINYRSSSDIKELKNLRKSLEGDLITGFKQNKEDDNIFGNSYALPKEKSKGQMHKPVSSSSNKFVEIWEKEIAAALRTILGKYTTEKFWKKKGFILKRINNNIAEAKQSFLDSRIGKLFRITLKRDCESRVRNPINFGNSIIAICNILQHSVEDDLYGTINPSDIAATLNLLEQSIRASTNYTDYPPESVFINDDTNPKQSLIFLLRNLAMHEFYELCLQFNSQLNDLNLTQKTYKLAKWVIDIAIADRQQVERKYT
ncbi:NDC1 [Candida oxycetoniae]|uniref:NDC1 n=1 Tax=Candida oxycetoniae TaxID=497107 RepID=A0AAI9T2B7_9ASCO|nr:NDC1 [Candida oxycetoniae]KAI3407111.2 NDC1 [Candida oxycetoniae]